MSGIFDGIQKIINSINSVVNGIIIAVKFIVNLCKSVGQLLQLLITTLGNVSNLIMTLPSWLLAIATAGTAVVILYLVVGRRTGQ